VRPPYGLLVLAGGISGWCAGCRRALAEQPEAEHSVRTDAHDVHAQPGGGHLIYGAVLGAWLGLRRTTP